MHGIIIYRLRYNNKKSGDNNIMFVTELKNIIKYAIELDIEYIETFLGYEGDNVLKITTKSDNSIKLLEKFIKNMGLAYKSEYDKSGHHSGSFILYVGVEDSSVFKLKRDKNLSRD